MVLSKAQLARYFYMQPSEIERMPYWEYELFKEKANEIIEEENKQQEGKGNSKEYNKYKKDADRYMKGGLPSYGNMGSGSYKVPSLSSMPSIPSI